jgi:hypothetical protein
MHVSSGPNEAVMKYPKHRPHHRVSLLSHGLLLFMLVSVAGCQSSESEEDKLRRSLREESQYLFIAYRLRSIPSIEDVYTKEKDITLEMRKEYDSMIVEQWEQIMKSHENGHYLILEHTLFKGRNKDKKIADPIKRKIKMRWAKVLEEQINLNPNLSEAEKSEALYPIQSVRKRMEAEEAG